MGEDKSLSGKVLRNGDRKHPTLQARLPEVDHMNFQRIHTNKREYYSIGVDLDTNRLVLEVLITWVAWYSRYFSISQEEFDWFNSSRNRLDELAASCAGPMGIANNQQRFIHSEKVEENRCQQA